MPERNIMFIEVKSWLCAPCARGKLWAELWIDAIKNAAITNDDYIFLKHNSSIAVDIKDHRDYAKKYIKNYKLDINYNVINDRFARHILYLQKCYNKISQHVSKSLYKWDFPFIMWWDHSTAWWTIAWITRQYPEKRLWVVRIDAHADIHSPYTTPSGNMHGMPLACALWLWSKEAKDIQNSLAQKWAHGTYNSLSKKEIKQRDKLSHSGWKFPMIQKEDIVYIGIRDIEPEEKDYINHYIKYFSWDYIQKNGIKDIIKKTLKHLNNCDIIYVSFDIDSIDGRIVHGTGTPVKDGISEYQAIQLLKELYASEKVVCMEIVEVNPLLDDDIGNVIDGKGNSKLSSFETRNGTAEIAYHIIKETIENFS